MIDKFNVFFFSEIDSTNTFLKEVISSSKLTESIVAVADYQFSGKGYQENVWVSEKGKNLTFSILLPNLKLKSDQVFLLNKVVSVSIFQFLVELGLEDVCIKWPNDILVNEKKICGILIQNSLSGENISNSIIGIGLNLNQVDFPNFKREATSVLLETQADFNKWKALKRLLPIITSNFELLQKDLFYFDRIYLENLYLKDFWRGFIIKGERINGKISGVNHLGQLQMILSIEKTVTLNMKEVEFL